MHLYLAGPMRGYELFNFPEFARATAYLRHTLGYEVTSPAEMDLDMGLDPSIANTDAEHDFDVEDAMRRDFQIILDADGIALLDGWEKSSGARAERFVAETTGKAVYRISRYGGSFRLFDAPEWSGDPRKPVWASLGLPEETRIDSLQDLIDIVRDEGFTVEPKEYAMAAEARQSFDVGEQKAIASGRAVGSLIEEEARYRGQHGLTARDECFPGESTREADERRRKAAWTPQEVTSILGAKPRPAGIGSDTTNPKDLLGVRKVQMHLVPESLVIHVAHAMTDGAAKYGPYNWREKAVRGTVYQSAAKRHLAAWFDGEEVAKDSGVHHLAHAAACIGIILDAMETGNLVDDRPTPGAAAALLERLTK